MKKRFKIYSLFGWIPAGLLERSAQQWISDLIITRNRQNAHSFNAAWKKMNAKKLRSAALAKMSDCCVGGGGGGWWWTEIAIC